MLEISRAVSLPDTEIVIRAVRAGGPGGQNVNKVATAAHLQFDIGASSLPEFYKSRLLKLRDRRISPDGVVTIKARRYRSLERNREDARMRLRELIRAVASPGKRRIPTRPTQQARRRRLAEKNRRGRLKTLRGRPRPDDGE